MSLIDVWLVSQRLCVCFFLSFFDRTKKNTNQGQIWQCLFARLPGAKNENDVLSMVSYKRNPHKDGVVVRSTCCLFGFALFVSMHPQKKITPTYIKYVYYYIHNIYTHRMGKITPKQIKYYIHRLKHNTSNSANNTINVIQIIYTQKS